MMSNYYASKAYVLLLSEGLRNEMSADGVVVTALCPGPTETELFARADMNNTLMARVPYLLTAAQVAESGYRALMRGRGVVVVGLFNKILAFSTRLAPRVVLASIARLINTKRPS
jgi:short-subunit dehydrogenase